MGKIKEIKKQISGKLETILFPPKEPNDVKLGWFFKENEWEIIEYDKIRGVISFRQRK